MSYFSWVFSFFHLDFFFKMSKLEACFNHQPVINRFLASTNGLKLKLGYWKRSVLSYLVKHNAFCDKDWKWVFLKCPSIFRLYGAKCYKCCRMISPTDWVRKAKDQVYHLACFACDSCKRQLSTGEEFGISENRVLCKPHYMETVDGGCTSSDGKHLIWNKQN